MLFRFIRKFPNKLDSILDLLQQIKEKEIQMSKEMEDLKAAVEASITVEESAIQLITSLAAQITAAANDPAAIEAIAAELNEKAAALAAAVTANTTAG
jgi:pyridoxine 5'-phosphate synthase PdxJ